MSQPFQKAWIFIPGIDALSLSNCIFDLENKSSLFKKLAPDCDAQI